MGKKIYLIANLKTTDKRDPLIKAIPLAFSLLIRILILVFVLVLGPMLVYLFGFLISKDHGKP